MEALAAHFTDALLRGESLREPLAAAGDAEPERSEAAFRRAAGDADLRPSAPSWAPALLRAARPGYGAACLEDLARRRREVGLPGLDVGDAPSLPLVLGCSHFLARGLLRDPARAGSLRGALPAPPARDAVDASASAIRRAKYDGLLRVAARDLAGRPFEESLTELSDLADACLRAALGEATAETGIEAPALFALGKLGGRELNFSSDVDLLFVFEPPARADELEHHRAVSDLIRHLKRSLEAPTEEGFGYRVDLDLRPEGKSGALANSVDAALAYYESFGAEWERQMLIRLRPVAGPEAAAARFAREIRPFVYRRSIDPGVLGSVRDMKARIESERRNAGRDLESDLKEGPGGIRDVEFLVQALQLFHGGQVPALRTGNVLAAIDELEQLSLLPEAAAASLRHSYLWLRRAEHAVQLDEERQSARFPRGRQERLELSRRMGYSDPEGETARSRMLEDWTAVRSEVRAHFESLVLRGGA